VRALIAAAAAITVDPAIVDYIVLLVAATREAPGVTLGASPRGSVALLWAARARALMQGRTFVTPSDV
jgi:MoxR-like ATPase